MNNPELITPSDQPEGTYAEQIEVAKVATFDLPPNQLFNHEYSADEVIRLTSTISNTLFTLREPTEIEVLAAVFDALQITPSIDDINMSKIEDTETSLRLTTDRADCHELLRLAINAYDQKYRTNGTRDLDAIDDLYNATQDVDQNPIIQSLRYLRQQHRAPVINHAEAAMRVLYDPR